MKEIIIAIYDGCYKWSVAVDGVVLSNDESEGIINDFYDIVYKGSREVVLEVMRKHSCNRLIYCEDGYIEIVEDKTGD